jgi:hypothetical protein
MSQPADMGSFISARDAALKAHLHPDYISRLARESKIASKRIGRRWYVDPSSLEAFISAQTEGKEARREELKQIRRQEYDKSYAERAESSTVAAIEEAIAENASPHTHQVVAKGVQHAGLIATPGLNMHAVSYAIHPGIDFLHKAIALFTAFILVFGSYGLIDREFGTKVADTLADGAMGAAAVSSVLIGDEPQCDSRVQTLASDLSYAVTSMVAHIDAEMPYNIESRLPSKKYCRE